MHFKNLLFIITSLSILLTTSFAKEKNEKVNLLLNWKHQYEFAGFYTALEKGYYKDLGLDVNIIEYTEDKDVINEVINGDIQYSITYSSLMNEYLKGKPLVFLANFLKKSPLIFAVNENIKTPQDLQDKKIMGLKNHFTTLSLMLEKFNLNLEDINQVPSSFSLEDFINKEVDGVAIYSTNELYNIFQAGIKYNILDPSFYGIHYYDMNLFTSQRELINHPQRVEKFVKATIKGWEYALKNPNEIINLVYHKYNTQNKSRDAIYFEAKQIEQLMLTTLYKIGSIDEYRVKMIIDDFKTSGVKDLRNDKNLSSFIYKTHSSKNPTFTKEEKNYIQNNTFKIGLLKDYYPFIYHLEDKAYGYSIEHLELLSKNSGLKFEYIAGDWSEIYLKFKNKEIDLIDTISYKRNRSSFTNFTDPYYEVPNAMFSLDEEIKNYINIYSLKDKKIGITKNVFYAQAIKDLKLFEVIEFENIQEKMKALVFGKIDVAFNSLLSGKKYIKDVGYSNVVILDELDPNIIKKEDLRIGVKKEDELLFSIIKKSLSSIPIEEKINLSKKWFEPKKNSNSEASIDLTKIEQQYLDTKKEIRMCVDPNWMPLDKIENGVHVGLAADYMKLFSRIINTPIKLVRTKSWNESIKKAKNRDCDIFSLASKTPERSLYMDFTTPYLELPIVIATKVGMPFIENLEQLENKKIGIVKGYSLIKRLKDEYPNLKIIEVDSVNDGLKQVYNGEIFGYIDNSAVINYSIQKNFLGNLAISGKFYDKFKMNIATRNDEKILNNILNKAILSIDKNVEHHIYNKWINIQYKKSINYELLFKISAFIAIVFLFLLYKHYMQGKNNYKLQNLNNQLEAILDTTLEAIIIFDDNSIIDCNKEALKLFKLSEKKKILSKNILDFIPTIDEHNAWEYLKRDHNEPVEVSLLKVNGEKFYALVRSRTIASQRDKLTVLSIVDLSDIKDKENIILHQSKMASMGEMLSNIAHQWRQPLSIITTYSSGLKLNAEYDHIKKDEIIKSSDSITKQAQYLSQTIDDFRNYFQSDDNFTTNFNIQQTMHKVEGLIHESFIANKIKVIINSKNLMLCTNEQLLIQSIINITNNVKDAIVNRKTDAKDAYLFIDINNTKNTLIITLKDSAGGIDKKILDKIFEPYFTTKHQAVGTGIGLYMTYQIITKQLNGDIKVRNSNYLFKGKHYFGAEFTIKIPFDKK